MNARRFNFAAILAIFGLMLFTPVRAETRSVDASIWAINGNHILLRVIEPTAEWQHLPGINGAPITEDDLGTYILGHFGAHAQGGNCVALDLGFDIGKITPMTYVPGMRRYEMELRCPSAVGIVVTDHALMDEVPGHVDEALISINNAVPTRHVFETGDLDIPATSPPVSIWHDITMGFLHFFLSPDRILFTLGMFALCGLGRDLGFALAGMVLGRILDLCFAGSGLLQPIVAGGEWIVGFLLLLLAAEIAGKRSVRAPVVLGAVMLLVALVAKLRGWPVMLPVAGGLLGVGYLRLRHLLPGAAWLFAVPAALFGIADGLNYWPDLALLGRPATAALAEFNVGYLLGAVALWALCWAANKTRFAPRASWAAVALAGMGSFLVVMRL